MPIDVDQYRRDTDRLLAALEEEFYLNIAGHKEDLELAPIYDRFADLTTAEAARELGALATRDSSVVHLWRSACEGYLEKVAKESIETVAGLEATLAGNVAGARIPYQMLNTEISNVSSMNMSWKHDESEFSCPSGYQNAIVKAQAERPRRAPEGAMR